MKKKTKIHQFNPTIYPRKLWVMKGGSVDDISDAFTEPDGEEIRLCIEGGKEPDAMTLKVCHRETGFLGVLVWLCVNDTSIKVVAHEAVHVASCIFEDCGMSMGFAADCINQVWTNKFRE